MLVQVQSRAPFLKSDKIRASGSHLRYRRLVSGLRLSQLLLFFQNCSPGFEALQLASSDRSLESGPPTPQEDVPADPTGALSVFVRNAESAYGKDIAFKVELNKAHTSDIAMQMKSRSGTALANVDFPEREISITIPAGQQDVLLLVPSCGGNFPRAPKK